MEIAVTGATGFLGRHLVKDLLQEGYTVRCLVRKGSHRRHELGSITTHIDEVDFENPNSIAPALKNSHTLLNSLGLINGSQEGLAKVNIEYTQNLINACRQSGIRRIVHVSSVAALMRHATYGITKFEGEKLIMSCGIPYLVFRPAYIYGQGDENTTAMILRSLKRFPVVPLLGGGDFKLQPVYIEDVCRVILTAMKLGKTNEAYTLAGSAQIPLKEMLMLMAKEMGLRRSFLPIPLKPLQAIARIYLRYFPNSKLPLKQVLELDKHQAFDISKTVQDLGFQPLPFDQGVREMFREKSCAA